MSIREEFEKYKDQFGLFQDRIGQTGGNGILYSAESAIILNQLNLLSKEDRNQLYASLSACRREEGLFNRKPGADDWQQAQDDYVGLASVAKELGFSDILFELLTYGEENHWVFNNVNPGKFEFKAFLGRFIFFIAHIKFANEVLPSLLQRLLWIVHIVQTSLKDKSHHDNWLLGWLLCYTAKGQSFTCDLAIRLFNWRLNKVTEGKGIGHIAAEYFANPEQPIGKYWSLVKL